MGFLTPSRQNPDSSKGSTPKRDYFSRYGLGGRLSPRRFAKRMRMVRMRPAEREYVKRVMERYDAPFTRGITKEEFEKGLTEMQKNKRDRITERHLKRIRRFFK